MRPIGFSTGAVAKGDFRTAIVLLRALGQGPIEISALREAELPALVQAAPTLDVQDFSSVTVHAPSRLDGFSEAMLVDALRALPDAWRIVAHPNVISSFAIWKVLESRLMIENMDQRKPIGRTARELEPYFDALPDARLCIDLGHARQIDPTMSVAVALLTRFASRLAQVHVSDVGADSEHRPLGFAAREAFASIARLIPDECPIIIESVVSGDEVRGELEAVRRTFSGRDSAAA